MNEMIVTTTDNIEGYVVVNYLKPVISNIVIGTSLFSDLAASFSDVLGTRSNSYQNKLSDMYELALEQLKEKAKVIGGNCILGLKADIDEISGKGMQMFMINAIGTAVIIKSIDEYKSLMKNKENEEEARIACENERREKLKSYDDLLKDEQIKNEAELYKKLYGESAYESFLKGKAKELCIDN